MSYETELLNKQYTQNIVLQIGSEYYSDYQPDSGLVVDADKVGLIVSVKTPAVTFDIKTVNTTTQTLSFELLDKDETISILIGNDDNALLQETVKCYAGFITGSFAFADYKLLSETNIKKIKKTSNGYAFDAAELTDTLNEPIYDLADSLSAGISNVDTSATIVDATGWPTSGAIKIDDEFILFSGRTGTTLTGLSRGDLSSLAASHSADAPVYFVYYTGNINPITLMLQLLISPGGGGPYDVLDDGIGLPASKVDVAGFEAIRTANFSTDLYRFYLYSIGKAMTFIQNELLLALNCRIFSKNGMIAIAILDQVNYSDPVPELNEDSVISNPSWEISSDNIINSVIINYAYSEGEKKYSRQYLTTDTDSITLYGEKPSLVLNFKGIQSDLGGAALVANRASRLLERLSTPQAKIKAKSQWDKSDFNFGQNIRLVHRYIPKQGGGLGIADQLEILSKSMDFNSGVVDYDLAYTSYANLRIGLIAPTHLIASVTSQSVFTISDASDYEVGYVLLLWNEAGSAYYGDSPNTILDITGNTITMTNAWVTTLTTNVRIKFADYDDASEGQKAKYAFVCDNSGFFTDGKKAYQIVF
jgi:hypothetical protein